MTVQLGLALLGTGRMAAVYGPKINAHPGLRLEIVYNPKRASAEQAAASHGGRAMDDLDAVLSDPKVDAVLIATPTNTHVDYIIRAAKAGKPIYCEKPLDQTLSRVDQAIQVLDAHPVPFMLGFNRRFDPDVAALQKAVQNGEIGRLLTLSSWSRDPAPPSIEYVRSSGGIFVDSTIHDIDLMCWLAGEWPEKVAACGSCMFDPQIEQEGDFDLTMTTLTMPSGALIHISNSRSCAYGFDQRIEAFGDDGVVQTVNHHNDNLLRSDKCLTNAATTLKHFFLERYDQSFYYALDAFHGAVTENRPTSPSANDGRRSLAIALACQQAAQSGQIVDLHYPDR